MADPLFRRLWAGEALASVSEQLFTVCLTLLVLQLSGPGPALGLVLAAAALPRAVLLPFGGVLADRVDPSRLVAATTWARAAMLGALAALVLTGPPPVAVVAALAAALGVLDAVYYPASLALLPRVVPRTGLVRANALVQGAESAGDLLGPAAAAGLVAVAGAGGALGAVAVLYGLAAAALTAVARRIARHAAARPAPAGAGGAPPTGGAAAPPLRALAEGLAFVRRDPLVRTVLLVVAVLNLAVVGPVLVGGAVQADLRLGGPEALGAVFAAFGAGSLAGLLAAGARVPRHRGAVLVAGPAAVGAGLVAFGLAGGLPLAVLAAVVAGVGSGYLGVVLVAWLQELVPAELTGRVMGLVVLASVAFDPVSFALAGAVLPLGPAVLLTGAGALVLACAALAAVSPRVRRFR